MRQTNCYQHNNHQPVYLCIQIHILLFFIIISIWWVRVVCACWLQWLAFSSFFLQALYGLCDIDAISVRGFHCCLDTQNWINSAVIYIECCTSYMPHISISFHFILFLLPVKHYYRYCLGSFDDFFPSNFLGIFFSLFFVFLPVMCSPEFPAP